METSIIRSANDRGYGRSCTGRSGTALDHKRVMVGYFAIFISIKRPIPERPIHKRPHTNDSGRNTSYDITVPGQLAPGQLAPGHIAPGRVVPGRVVQR